MKDLIIVTNMNDDTKATLTVTKLTQSQDHLTINAYPFHIPRNEIKVGQYIKAKHYPDPDFKLLHTFKGKILSIQPGQRITTIIIQLNNNTEPDKPRQKTVFQRLQGALKSLGL